MTTSAADRDRLVGRLAGHGAMVLFAAIISGSFSLGALAAPHIDPSALTAVRFAIAVAAMMALVALAGLGGAIASLGQGAWRFLVLGALYGGYFVCMFEALRLSPPAPLAAVFTLTPLMTAGFAYALAGQPVSAPVLAALVLGGLGAVWVIFDGGIDALLALEVGLGEAIFLLGAVGHALYAALLRKLRRGEPLLVFVLGVLIGALLVVSLSGAPALLATPWAELPGVVWIAAVYLALCATVLTASLLQIAAQRLPASKVMAYTYLPPSLVILIEGWSGRGWAPVEALPGVALTLVALIALAWGRDAEN